MPRCRVEEPGGDNDVGGDGEEEGVRAGMGMGAEGAGTGAVGGCAGATPGAGG